MARDNAKPKKVKPPRKRGWNYPREGYGPIHRWLPSWRVVTAFIFACIACGVVAFATLYATIKVPSPADFALAQKTTIYYSDGKTPMGTLADYDRESVKLSTLPEYVPHAVVASEDQTFYTNNGISLRSIARAAINNLKGGAPQGGSTLTQQYVERFYLGTTKDYVGKVKEAILALKIDRQQSKDEILENYLNTIYFGRGAYGIERASQKYFGISAKDLTLDQAALLVAVIPAPSAWDPAVNPDRAKQRWDRVLRNMVDLGYAQQSEVDALAFPQTIPVQTASSFSGTKGYILQAVSQELTASGKFTADELSTSGLKIVTTINADTQQAAVDAVATLPASRPENNYVGLVAVDPRNGEIAAMYGGADFAKRQRNAVTQDRAQGGSTFKPFTLLAALEQDIPLSKTFNSASPMKIGGVEIKNYNGRGLGTIDLLTATKHSVNTVYVQLNEEVGPSATREAAIKAGLPEKTPGLDDSLTNVLGSASPRPIDMARVYSTYANGGKVITPHLVREVYDSRDVLVYSGNTEGEQVFDKETITQLTYALQQPTSAGGTAAATRSLGRPVAGKTGTSSGPWSAWFCGYIPQLVTVVDMYQVGPNGEEQTLTGFGKYSIIGGNTYPVDIWTAFMKAATKGMDIEQFDKPKKLVAPSVTSSDNATTEGEAPQPTEGETGTDPQGTGDVNQGETNPSENGGSHGESGAAGEGESSGGAPQTGGNSGHQGGEGSQGNTSGVANPKGT